MASSRCVGDASAIVETEGGGSRAEWLCQMRAIEIKMKHACGRALLPWHLLAYTSPDLTTVQRLLQRLPGGWLVMMVVVIHVIK